jgi:hypothetical protein
MARTLDHGPELAVLSAWTSPGRSRRRSDDTSRYGQLIVVGKVEFGY